AGGAYARNPADLRLRAESFIESASMVRRVARPEFAQARLVCLARYAAGEGMDWNRRAKLVAGGGWGVVLRRFWRGNAGCESSQCTGAAGNGQGSAALARPGVRWAAGGFGQISL